MTEAHFDLGKIESGLLNPFSVLEPVIGRFVTLQKIAESDPNGNSINWGEVIIDSSDAIIAELETVKLAVDSSFNKNVPVTQCPSDKPYAYQGGARCCGLEVDTEAASENTTFIIIIASIILFRLEHRGK